MELWGRKNAYNVLKVLWILDELELAYQNTIMVAFDELEGRVDF
jgi:glutathione S-transferase